MGAMSSINNTRIRRSIRLALLAIVVLVALLAVAWYCQTDYWRGYIAARVHHLVGHEELKTVGVLRRDSVAIRQLVWDRHRVWLAVGAGCVCTDAELEYVRGYNDATEERLRPRLGEDPWRAINE